jgi:hypothetical protein
VYGLAVHKPAIINPCVEILPGESAAVRKRISEAQTSVLDQDEEKRLKQLDAADEQEEAVIDVSAVQAALEKLKNHPEPEARFMRMGSGYAPAYNVQTAVDTRLHS